MSAAAVRQHLCDAGSIPPAQWPFREIVHANVPRAAGFQVVIQQAVLQAVHKHGQSNTKVEVCGVLVGRLYHDESGAYLLIHASIAGAEAHSNAANVTFTADTWSAIHEQMDLQFPEDEIVGWYHTHPAFDIFLSEMDLFIHRNFFDQPWQVAFVYDPVRGDEGMFVWRNGEPTREPIIVEADASVDPAPISPPRGEGRLFAAIVLIFVLLLLVLLIFFEYNSPPPVRSGPFGVVAPKWSNASQWIARR